ncbi:hypothetical protein [Winogradskyella helgolandensis]|uniref:hypothetical protein n=1 Tax=Winogradskyella helgolandensis TaxID=2697010 RepID=UPI0015CDD6FE|nr:hypothetical protein [Winogradskyella helgolandensis]
MKNKLFTERKTYYKYIAFCVLLLMASFTYAQVGVGNTNPQATLDITASNQAAPSNVDGILIPRIDTFPATNPTAAQDAMLVYLTTTVGLNSKGFYYWDQATTSWIRFSSIEKLNDLSDAKSDVDGTNDGSSVFIGIDAGLNDDSSHNQNVGVGYNALMTNVDGDANSAFGYEALKLSTGINNSAFGFKALTTNSAGRRNSAFGRGALEGNTTAFFNTAMGTQALTTNTTGASNVAVGESSLFSNDSGSNNTAVGTKALYTNTGNDNVAIGNLALYDNVSGDGNTAVGTEALTKATVDSLTAVGYHALFKNVTGTSNTAVGYEALNENVSGSSNSAFGHGALRSNTSDSLTAVGYHALHTNTSGAQNTAVGYKTLNNVVTSNNSSAFGHAALSANTSGNNSAFGSFAGDESSGNSNVLFGNRAGSNLAGDSNVLVGQHSGRELEGDSNVFIGKSTGRRTTGNNNVFIGHNAGFTGTQTAVDNTLLIENSSSATPLIYGEFDNDILRVNGELQVAEPGVTNGYAFPIADGTADQILVTDGAGQLTFEDQQTIPVVPDVSTFSLITTTFDDANPPQTITMATAMDPWDRIDFDTVTLNATGSAELSSGNQFVAATAGYYRVNASYHTVGSQDNTEYFGIAVLKNTAVVQEFSTNHYNNSNVAPDVDSQVARQISSVVYLAVGDTVEIHAQSSAAGVVIDKFSGKTYFTIERIR